MTHPAFQLSFDDCGRLVLAVGDRRHVGVRPVRAFPFSDPHSWISLCDAEGNELLSIEHLDDLPRAAREILNQALADREFLPIIRRILSIVPATDPCRWQVQTDRGPTSFLLDSDDDIHKPTSDRVLIVDADHMRYLIPSIQRLDHRSRRWLERFL